VELLLGDAVENGDTACVRLEAASCERLNTSCGEGCLHDNPAPLEYALLVEEKAHDSCRVSR